MKETCKYEQCSGLTSIAIPNSVTEIGYGIVRGCSGLIEPVYNSTIFAYMPSSYEGSYTIPEGITTISSSAFRDCSGLTSIIIPSSVTSIGSFAFDGCSGLTSVKVNWNRPLTRSYNICGADYTSEYSVYNIATLYVPKGTVMMYMTADEWSEFANILEFEDGEDVHYITIRMGDGGVLKQSVDVGKTYTYTVCADEGWEVNTLTFDGKDMTSLLMDGQFSTPVITGNAELNVVFKQIGSSIKEMPSMTDVKVYASNSSITITGAAENATVAVYSINGALVISAVGNSTFSLESGVYIVKVGSETFKVRL